MNALKLSAVQQQKRQQYTSGALKPRKLAHASVSVRRSTSTKLLATSLKSNNLSFVEC